MKESKRMNRLVLGDVGSGKTIVAIVAILANFLSGYQSTFMAPTEILAKQHYESIKEYFKEYDINISLLTGSITKKQLEQLYLFKEYLFIIFKHEVFISFRCHLFLQHFRHINSHLYRRHTTFDSKIDHIEH